MRLGIAIILLMNIATLNAQEISEAKAMCEKYIVNGMSIASNETIDGLESGVWTYSYDKKGIETSKIKNVKSLLIVSYQVGVPVGTCVICGTQSNLLGIESYVQDTSWTENGKFLWFNKKGILTNEENYSDGLLDGKKTDYFKNGQIKSDFEYRNDTVISAKHYWSNGNIQKTYDFTYSPDTTTLLTCQYTKEGTLLYSDRKVNDLKDGSNIVYYKNGNKRIEGLDEMGVRLKETFYHKDGTILKLITCDRKTKQCNVKEYDKNGRLKKEYSSTFNGYGIVIYK